YRWHFEALRAQAVAARSYALSSLSASADFDLYADQRSQVYAGIRAERRSTNLAVGSTAGQVLRWQGIVARTYYDSSSGGRTAAGGRRGSSGGVGAAAGQARRRSQSLPAELSRHPSGRARRAPTASSATE